MKDRQQKEISLLGKQNTKEKNEKSISIFFFDCGDLEGEFIGMGMFVCVILLRVNRKVRIKFICLWGDVSLFKYF